MTINEESPDEIKDSVENGQETKNMSPLVQIANALNMINQRVNGLELSVKQINANIQLLAKNIDINEKQINLAFREIESLEKKL